MRMTVRVGGAQQSGACLAAVMADGAQEVTIVNPSGSVEIAMSLAEAAQLVERVRDAEERGDPGVLLVLDGVLDPEAVIRPHPADAEQIH